MINTTSESFKERIIFIFRFFSFCEHNENSCSVEHEKNLTLGPRLKKSAFSPSARLLPAKSSINFVHYKTELLRGGSRISEKGVHVYKGVWGGVALLILCHFS